MELDEKHIISEIRKGNATAFKDVYRAYYAPLCRFANKYFEDPQEAEDIVQDTMVKMYEQGNKLDIQSLRSYLFSAVKNSCLNRLSHLTVVQKHFETAAIEIKMIELEHEDAFDEDNKKTLEKKVFDAINELPEQCGKIVKMHYIDGMKSKEIATATNLSPRTIETHLYKGLKTLSHKFKDFIPNFIIVVLLFLHFLYVNYLFVLS